MNDEIISVKNIKKVFYTEDVETHALRDVSFSVKKGEFVSITGASGCGKSTLLSLLGLLDTPTSGTYILNGHDVSNLKRSRRASYRNTEIGFIFQAFNLISELTVFENVALPLTYRTDISKARRKELVETVLKKVKMDHRAGYYPSQLSGGQQQRVAVARALASSPAIILADEPTGNLDSENADSVMNLLKELHAEGATICMVTHDPRSGKAAQRTIFLKDGMILTSEQVHQEAMAVSATNVVFDRIKGA
jgi:putative ABC transport system ATP-binding protein